MSGNAMVSCFSRLMAGAAGEMLRQAYRFTLPVSREITFADSTVYVATDEGVLSSETGAHWRVLTNSAGTRPIIDRFAVVGTTICGISDIGVYRLDTGNQWEKISSEALGKTVALAVINDKLYSAIKDRGIYHISLAEK